MTITELPESQQPIDERLRIAREEWADLNAAASLKEEMKTPELERRILALRQDEPGTTKASAETYIKASEEWHNTIRDMVEARRLANRKWAYVVGLQTKFNYWTSMNANKRQERFNSR